MGQAEILHQYPWLRSASPKYVVMGDDLDAALSTLLYLRHNPQAVLVGIYKGYQALYVNARLSKRTLEEAIYLDLDICHPTCRSLGHHIVRLRETDALAGFSKSCNVNELRQRSVAQQYVQKYPLGTVHFLLWLYDVPIPDGQYAESLIWLADSAFINGQSHRFRDNVAEWLQHFLPHPPLQAGFARLDTESFEAQMADLQALMTQSGLSKGTGQITSRHRQLTGFQCQPTGREDAADMQDYTLQLLRFVARLTGWVVPKKQIAVENFTCLQGVRRSGRIVDVLGDATLDDFLAKQRVFSYVFPYKDRINYTTRIL